ncbi:hypothetical protein [Nocardiopsis trehalosi]|uniref:hypothetical protein n=1 Tax=Nocardiopsis trehalosi TaxID=109329 RepID=UPI0008330ACA|nr:hypothetical protein [Nocardiopsis trehalosi]
MSERPAISVLTLRHRIPDDWAADPWAEVRPLIDGVDVLQEVHPEGLAPSRRHWAGPPATWPLAAAEEPRRVMITEPVCTAGCCGALYVTLRRAGDRVVWDSWENTSGGTAVPPAVHFDAARYDAELARAAADHSWEGPVDTIARLLERTLTESGWFERWDCVLLDVSPRRAEPDLPEEVADTEGVDVWFREGAGGGPGLYGYRLTTAPDRPADRQARWFAERILADDPRRTADVREG